jgi:hypothetical protein
MAAGAGLSDGGQAGSRWPRVQIRRRQVESGGPMHERDHDPHEVVPERFDHLHPVPGERNADQSPQTWDETPKGILGVLCPARRT